jgi:hypothetical protein
VHFKEKRMKSAEIQFINEQLRQLPRTKVQEVRDYIDFMIEKEKKRRAFENRVLAAEKEPTKVYETAEQAMQAILNATED